MFNEFDHTAVYADEFPESARYVGRRYDEKLDDAIRMDESRQALHDSSSPDYWHPDDDWMLD